MDRNLNTKNVIQLLGLMEDGGITRKTVAEALGISIKTAGNLASSMIFHKMIKEYTEKSSLPGRNAGVLVPSAEPVFAVVHVMYDHIFTNYFGYNLKICESDVTDIDDHLFLDDFFVSFFRRIALRRPSVCSICIVADGIPVMGKFTNSAVPGLDGICFKAFVEEHLPTVVVRLENRYLCSVKNAGINDVIFTDEYGSPRVYLINNAAEQNARRSVPLYNFYHHVSERDIFSVFKYSKNNNEYVRAVSGIFCDIINLISPDRIYFTSGRYKNALPIVTKIYECLSLEYSIPDHAIPSIVSACDDFDLSLPAIRRKIRDEYVKNVNFSTLDK